MPNRRVCAVGAIAASVLLAALSAPVAAKVTITGKVEYWDKLAKGYKPAKNVLVEVEGDWFAFDPRVTTNDQGIYQATQRDPYWGTFDISIDAYAETPGLIEIYEDMFEAFFEMYPYHATSPTVKGVKGGQTCTINLKIGGGKSNVSSVWTRTVAETANAFIVHQEMYGHYRTLLQRGFVSQKFHEVEVIVPAAGVKTPYYNHFTGYINLCIDAAGYSGTGSWANIHTWNDQYVKQYKDFPMTVRHEYSHAIHDSITGIIPPLGLNMPAEHSPKEETNRWLAFTEGWAAFLPLTTINMGGMFEPTRTVKGSTALPISAASPPGGHYAWEGEVTALLWDIYDPANQEELVRHPATKATSGEAAPKAIVDKQTFTDRIADANLSKTKQAIKKYFMPPGPADTIAEFLSAYKGYYPGELHALKAIAFNRDIIKQMPKENAAYIAGAPTADRGAGPLTLKLTVTEPDPEDRPYVRVSVWRQAGNAAPSFVGRINLSGGWQGANRPTTVQLNAPGPSGPNDVLWIIVSDEMLPMAYRIQNPPKAAIHLAQPLPPYWFGRPPTRDPSQLQGPMLQVQPMATGPFTTSPTGPSLQQVQPYLTDQRQRSAATLRDLVQKCDDELSKYAARRELAARYGLL
ncbi:MAG: hypothetical protein ACE5JM_12835, partial [Armatimonadota bacterium]